MSPLLAVEMGDSYEKVVAEKGAPVSKVEAAGATVLNYTDVSIKLRDDKVVSVTPRSVEKAANVPASPVYPPKPKAGTASSRPKPGPAPAAEAGAWTTNYEEALNRARAENKKVFLFFTGSDWCGWCKKFEHEILSTSEFKAYAHENLILVKLDFPRKTPQSDEVKKANHQLLQQYGVRGFPTVIILDSSGSRVGELGYMKGGPQPFLQALGKL